ncbi:uncharacterized protein E0L32_006266 [Thyridium curvatum]|uniref:Extracellular membrane protein CFEM domain-containing protein n=1 Tax=Thyridium curvatum TaxID=1093900 RepID=A0A507B063_9PEZI|nr:uncharacterized protein E0L32_006266 [Thyridium curvatum]TPX13293.1 hypothetical protein E0L32_006266 [Thyridium curvatum]
MARFTLSDEFTKFIPPCATDCFQLFLENNFSPDTCGTSPSLQCLCSRTGSSSFTIGEGAVACIAAGKNSGACPIASGDGEYSCIKVFFPPQPLVLTFTSDQTITKAYRMCNGQPSAVVPTHATIIATLAVPKSTPSASSASTSSSSLSTPLPSTLLTATDIPTPPSSRPSPTFALPTVDPQPTTAAPDAQAGDSNRPKLNTGQIIGISMGGAALALLIFTVFLLARCSRRKRLAANEEQGFSKMRDSWPFGRNPDGSPQMPQISNPTYVEQKEMDFTRPTRNNRSSVQPDSIGLAISPEQTLRLVPNQQSKDEDSTPSSTTASAPVPVVQKTVASPVIPKPALTLAIPNQQGLAPPAPRMPFSGRESVVTEFAEDGETDIVSAGVAQIWRPPATDPQSATTYYVADKWGNWRRASQMAELDGSSVPVAKTNASQAVPLTLSDGPVVRGPDSNVPSKPQPAQLGPPIQFRPEPADLSRSSSIYSNYSLPQIVVPTGSNPMPPPLFMGETRQQPMQQAGPNKTIFNKLPNRKSKGAERSDPRQSTQSNATTIESSAGDDDNYQNDLDRGSLSPVQESPISAGVSPVSYPKIPRSQQNNGLNIFPPSTRTNNLYSPPGQPSPTLGAVAPVKNQQYIPYIPPRTNAQQQYGRTLTPNPNPNRNPAQIRTGSPNAPQKEQGQANERPNWQSYTPQNPYDDEQQRPASRNKAAPGSPSSSRSAASSLLAKRLGADRAAALALDKDGKRSKGPKWKRHKSVRGGADEDWTPSTPRGTNSFGGDDDIPLPATPGWLPKLTPTRHGDDLFLRVR